MRAPSHRPPPNSMARGTWALFAVCLVAACGPTKRDASSAPGAITAFTATPTSLGAAGGTVTLDWKTKGTPFGFQLVVSPADRVTVGANATAATGTVDLGTATSVTVSLPNNGLHQPLSYQFTLLARFQDPWATDSANTDVTLAAAPNPGDTIWLTQFGSSGNDTVQAVAIGPSGNIAVAGQADGAIGGTTGTQDPFVAEFDPTGKELWLRVIDTSQGYAAGVTFNPNGNVYVAGSALGNLAAPPAGGYDVFLVAYDPTGRRLWATQSGTAGNDAVVGLGIDGSGHLFVAGQVTGSGTQPDMEVFLSRYDDTGAHLWTKNFGTSGSDLPHAVAADDAGNAVVVGATSGAFTGTNAGGTDAFLVEYDAAGNQTWVRQFGTAQDDEADAVAMGPGDTFAVAYRSPGAGTYPAVFAARFDAQGNQTWSRAIFSGHVDRALGVSTDAGGLVTMAGYTTGHLQGSNVGMKDAFAARFGPDGQRLWVAQLGTAKDDIAFAVADNTTGRVILAGTTDGTLGQTSFGQTDAFVAALAP